MEFILRGASVSISKWVARYELGEISTVDGPSFYFVFDVYKTLDKECKYFPKVYRREFFRLNPSFQNRDDENARIECDEELLVEDIALTWQDHKMDSVEQVVVFVIEKLKEIFD